MTAKLERKFEIELPIIWTRFYTLNWVAILIASRSWRRKLFLNEGRLSQTVWLDIRQMGCTQLIGLLNSFAWTVYTERDFKIRKLQVGLTETIAKAQF